MSWTEKAAIVNVSFGLLIRPLGSSFCSMCSMLCLSYFRNYVCFFNSALYLLTNTMIRVFDYAQYYKHKQVRKNTNAV